jgi:hypothetical protein
VTNFENVGDDLTNGVSVEVDGVQESWSYRCQDINAVGAACGVFALPFSVGTLHTIQFTCRNNSTVLRTSVIACPWILGDVPCSAVTLNFSQGSTVYAYVEPLFLNLTKTIGLGVKRAVSFGVGTDYYASSAGTGLISFSYTISLFDISSAPASSLFTWSGTGGCIGAIAVDVA